MKLNYGVDYQQGQTRFSPTPSTWQKMTHILLHWAARGVDAFRCDMAEMVPEAFWQYAIAHVKAAYPSVLFIAEVYNPARYRGYIGAGFDYLYDKVGLYDTLRAVVQGSKWAADITTCWQTVEGIGDNMLHFLENHDEQRIASDFFASNAEAALPAFFVAALMSRAAVMVYAGQEVGEPGMDAEGYSGRDGRTTIFDYWRVEKLQRLALGLTHLTKAERNLYDRYATLTRLCSQNDIVRQGGFYDLMYANFDHPETFNAARQYAFLRYTAPDKTTKKAKTAALLCLANFDGQARQIEVRVPEHAFGCCHLLPGRYTATDLLSRQSQILNLQPDTLISVALPAYGGLALHITK